jgi:septum site-determining protein MinD
MALDPDSVVAIAGGKGGTGKTTAALGLAQALVDRGFAPVVADADLDLPDLHARADVDREPGLPALLDGMGPATVLQESPRYHGVSVIAAGTGRIRTHRALTRLAELDRPILVDCPPGAGPDAVDPLRSAAGTILVTTPTRAGRQDAAKTAGIVRAVGGSPVAWLERLPGESRRETAEQRPKLVPTVSIPDVRGPPLEHSAIRGGFRELSRAVYDADSPTQSGSTGWSIRRNF